MSNLNRMSRRKRWSWYIHKYVLSGVIVFRDAKEVKYFMTSLGIVFVVMSLITLMVFASTLSMFITELKTGVQQTIHEHTPATWIGMMLSALIMPILTIVSFVNAFRTIRRGKEENARRRY